VNDFTLTAGEWVQVGPNIADFSVTNDFTLGDTDTAIFKRFAGGTGASASHAYLIDDVYGLQGIDSAEAMLSNHFKLNRNIEANVTENWNGALGFDPIGGFSSGEFFEGTFDGQDFEIRNLVINNNSTSGGLFSIIAGSSEVKNFSLITPDIYNRDAGALAFALAYRSGIEPYFQSFVDRVYVKGGSIESSGYAGGLFAFVEQGAVITNSGSSAAVTGNGGVGGLIGAAEWGGVVLDNVYATGDVVNSSSFGSTGGLVGYLYADPYFEAFDYDITINKAFSSGTVTVNGGSAGGFVGVVFQEDDSGNLNITDSYSHSNIVNLGASGNLGGFVGYAGDASTVARMTLNSVYSTGSVTFTPSGSTFAGAFAGTLVATVSADVIDSFYDSSVNTLPIVGNGETFSVGAPIGRSTAQMKMKSTFTSAGWDFNNIWQIDSGPNYPTFRLHPLPGVLPVLLLETSKVYRYLNLFRFHLFGSLPKIKSRDLGSSASLVDTARDRVMVDYVVASEERVLESTEKTELISIERGVYENAPYERNITVAP